MQGIQSLQLIAKQTIVIILTIPLKNQYPKKLHQRDEFIFILYPIAIVRRAYSSSIMNMVTSKYGMSSHKDTEDGCRFYQYFDMKLSFCLDSSNIVQSISFENYPKKP